METQTEYPILSSIRNPNDVKKLSQEQMTELGEEIRRCLVERVSENGGHLASNLGVVELSMAIDRVFDLDRDHVIYDVGHQSYVHKLLSGRFDRFCTLRQPGGISGFPRRDESPYDSFGTGHGSTSLSAALGFAKADKLAGSDAFSIAVIGDGAYTGGMIHEALNNYDPGLRLIIVLNENEMSISKNIGTFAKILMKLRNRPGYYRTKARTRNILLHIPLLGKPLFRFVRFVKKKAKNLFYGSNYFEDMGLYYLGPADGNNYRTVESLLTEAKNHGGSAIIHLKTSKGKGYEPAEEQPDLYHGVRPASSTPKGSGETFSSVFGEALCKEAEKDEKICAITAAMTAGTGLEPFEKAFPERFFDVGMAEEHAVTFAAGLAANGYRPVVAIYSTFLQRAYDQILHDVALQRLPVVFCIDRAGLNQADGATHHGIFDVSFLSSIPGMTLYSAATYGALREALHQALSCPGPVAVRYCSGSESQEVAGAFYTTDVPFPAVRKNFSDGTECRAYVLVHGRMAAAALKACRILADEGITTGVLLTEILKPYGLLLDKIRQTIPEDGKPLLCVEEEIRAGGMGMMLHDEAGCDFGHAVEVLAPRETFAEPGEGQTVFEAAGVSAEQIAQAVRKIIRN